MESKEIVERGTILRTTVGSTIHGVHHGGQDDRDEMAVFVEPPEYRLGLRLGRQGRKLHPLEYWVERTQPEGVRSGPGDLDLVAYNVRKYRRLTLPMPEPERCPPSRARLGERPFDEVIAEIDEVEARLVAAPE